MLLAHVEFFLIFVFVVFLLIEAIQCTACPQGQWSQERSTNCTEPTFDVLSWDTYEALVITLAAVLVVVCQGSVGVVFLKHRGTFLVRASGGALSVVALLSLIGACLSVLLFLGQPGDTVCRLQLPLTSILQTVALSIITSISLQVSKDEMLHCVVEWKCYKAANSSFRTDILRVRVPTDCSASPAYTTRPRKLAVSADLLRLAGWYLWMVCSGGTFSV